MCSILILILIMLLCFLYINHFEQLRDNFYLFLNHLSSFVKINSNNLNNSNNSENEKFKNISKNMNGSGDGNVNSVLRLNKNNTTDNKDLIHYNNDTINQSKINENAYDVVNQIDKIDYSNVKTGMDKCRENCKGVCFELGYTGNATCYPKQNRTFDYGTLYKNPAFSYGTNAYKPKSPKE